MSVFYFAILETNQHRNQEKDQQKLFLLLLLPKIHTNVFPPVFYVILRKDATWLNQLIEADCLANVLNVLLYAFNQVQLGLFLASFKIKELLHGQYLVSTTLGFLLALKYHLPF